LNPGSPTVGSRSLRGQTLWLGAFAVCLIDIPRYLFQLFQVPLPYVGSSDPPVLLVILGAVAFLQYVRGNKPISSLFGGDRLFAVGLLVGGAVLEIQSLFSGANPDFGLLRQFLWLIMAFYLVGSYVINDDDIFMASKLFIYILVAFSAILVTLWFLYHAGFNQYYGFLSSSSFGGWNGFSLLCVVGIVFLLFDPGLALTIGTRAVLSTPLALIPLFERSRSAIALMVAVFSLWFLKLALVWIGRLCAVRWCRLALQCVLFGLLLIAAWVVFYPAMVTQVSFLALAGKDNRTIAVMGSDLHSSYSRYFSAIQVLGRFIDSPWFGQGYSEVNAIEVAGYRCHTLWALVLGAYVAVAVSVLIMCLFVFLSVSRIRKQVWLSVGLMTCLIVVSSTTNDVWLWYILLFLPFLRWKSV
jgi:hypothetical protein